MKKITGLLIAFFILTSIGLKAQHDVKINALALLFKSYGFGYEYVINDEMGAGISLSYANSFGFGLGDEFSESSFSALKITPEFRFYFSPEDGADGFYFGAYIKYATVTWADLEYTFSIYDPITFTSTNFNTKYDLTFNGLAFGIQSGKKWVTNSGFFLETNFSFGRYLSGSVEYSNSAVATLFEDNFSPAEDAMNIWYTFDFGFALNIGWRFGQ
ncbi:MAG: hypothetical protein COA97_00835 [Flavobacteriales bacterium]|nr:MAG: hypothetical protein COA97_00835 [Flavobacteriales bacterium]